MQNFCIVVLCGLPGSGKTSFVKKLVKWTRENPCLHSDADVEPGSACVTCCECKQTQSDSYSRKQNHLSIKCKHISYDQLIPANLLRGIIEADNKLDWKNYRHGILSCTEELIRKTLHLPADSSVTAHVPTDLSQSFQEMVITGEPQTGEPNMTILIIDDNNYYRSMRYEYYQLARKYKIGYSQVYIDCDVEEALKNNANREESVPPDIVMTMSTRLEPPSDKESWEKLTAVLKLDAPSQQHIEKVLELILEALRNPVVPRLTERDPEEQKASRQACLNSLIHQADLVLRQCVKHTMAGLKKKEKNHMNKGQMKNLGEQINCLKSTILSELQNNKLKIPEDIIDSASHTQHGHGESDRKAVHNNDKLAIFISKTFRERLEMSYPDIDVHNLAEEPS